MNADRIRECLNDIGWSQRQLARALGIDDSMPRAWCRGARDIPPDVADWLEDLAQRHRMTPPPLRYGRARA